MIDCAILPGFGRFRSAPAVMAQNFSIRRHIWQERERKAEPRATVKERGKTLSVLCPSALLLGLYSAIYPDDGLIMAFKENPNILGAPSVIREFWTQNGLDWKI